MPRVNALRLDLTHATLAPPNYAIDRYRKIAQMREYVTPWHKKIVELIHEAGRPAILHSCGNLVPLWEDIIDDIGYDAKHSYEDTILPVEEAYQTYGDRIAILGGIDMGLPRSP